jgi:hypothetical protein
MMRWTEDVEHVEYNENACNLLLGKSEERALLDRPSRIWEGNIQYTVKKQDEWVFRIGASHGILSKS